MPIIATRIREVALLAVLSCFWLAACAPEPESQASDPQAETMTWAQKVSAPPPPKDQKLCFGCNASGTVPCSEHGCVSGRVECPGPCLRLSRGAWVRMNVPGHNPNELWQKFPSRQGGYQSWSQEHVGEVIAMQKGVPVNIGKCQVCGGSTRVACKTCQGRGRQGCELCEGKKYVPLAWTPTNNPWLNRQPDLIRLTDGTVLLGKVVLSSSEDWTIRLRDGQFTRVRSKDIVRATEVTVTK